MDNGNGSWDFSSEDGVCRGNHPDQRMGRRELEVTETSNPDAFPVGQKRNFRLRFKENRISESNTPRPDRSAMPGGAGEFVCRILPDSQHMLHEQTHESDADPAAKAQCERFTAGFDEFYNVCI